MRRRGCTSGPVDESVPSQQGLKQRIQLDSCVPKVRQRVRSITTRIETRSRRRLVHCQCGRRVRSITTRIETRSFASRMLADRSRRRVRSITTRIETSRTAGISFLMIGVNESVPSQQGLKLRARNSHRRVVNVVNESVPSQQGLKQYTRVSPSAVDDVLTSPFHHNKD